MTNSVTNTALNLAMTVGGEDGGDWRAVIAFAYNTCVYLRFIRKETKQRTGSLCM
jgi:hypothetical protein